MFWHYSSMDIAPNLSHTVLSETGMDVARLLNSVDDERKVKIQVRCKGIPDLEYTPNPLNACNKINRPRYNHFLAARALLLNFQCTPYQQFYSGRR